MADLHLANHKRWGSPTRGAVAPLNTRAKHVIDVLTNARRAAEARGVTDLFILGDVFDTVHPEPQLIAELSMALASLNDLLVHILVGNHDQVSDAPGDHALIALDGVRNVQVHEKPTIVSPQTGDGHVWMVPYRPGKASEYLPGLVHGLADGHHPTGSQVLALHLGLSDDKTDPWLQKAHDQFPAAEIEPRCGKFSMTFAGNWHGRNEVVPNVWQVGALVPTGFDNPGLEGYGSLLITDGKQVGTIVMDGPRFLKAVGVAGVKEALEQAEKRGSDFPTYVSARCRVDERPEVEELFELFGHQHHEVLTDKAAVEDAARQAAGAASAATPDGVRAAIEAYVSKLDLPADIQRELVAAKAVDYVAGVGA